MRQQTQPPFSSTHQRVVMVLVRGRQQMYGQTPNLLDQVDDLRGLLHSMKRCRVRFRLNGTDLMQRIHLLACNALYYIRHGHAMAVDHIQH
jgi:hypothetical protein